jgi:hypothetical protein
MKLSRTGLEINNIRWSGLALIFIAVSMFWHLLYVRLSDNNKQMVIWSDAAGYYAYLPAVFIHHDLKFNFCKDGEPTKVDAPGANHHLFLNRMLDGQQINKYFIGTALMQMPFFFGGKIGAQWFAHPKDGYSFPFQASVAIAGLFYAFLGLLQIRKFLLKINVSDVTAAATLLLIFFGTNLYYYTLQEPGMSHAFSFCMVAVFINQVHNLIHNKNPKAITGAVLSLAMIVLIRPVNGVAIFAVPFIAGSWPALRSALVFIRQNLLRFGISSALALLLLFLQLLVWKISVNHWFADSYAGEAYDFTNAHIYNILFSWRKGFFIYTPIMILALIGIWNLRTRFAAISFVIFFLMNVWFVASWQLWSYGGSFGMRPMIDTYAVMAVPLALFLDKKQNFLLRLIKWAPAAILMIYNMIQIYQYTIGVLPYDEMTWQKYKKIFLETSRHYSCIYDPGSIRTHTMPQNSELINSHTRTFDENSSVKFNGYWGVNSEKAFSGKYSACLDTGKVTAGLNLMFRDNVPDSVFRYTWARIKAKIFLPEEKLDAKLAVQFMDSTETYAWEAPPLWFLIDQAGEWTDLQYDVKLPTPKSPNGSINVYLYHDDKSAAYIDDLTVEFWVEPH